MRQLSFLLRCVLSVGCREDIFKEIDILCGLNHENVVYLKEYFEEGNKVSSASCT